MKTKITASLETAISKSNIDLCASRVHLVLVAAFSSGNLDSAIEKFEATINSVVDTLTDEQSE